MLEGIRVLDFTQNLPGPYATLRLADMGAEVIKVEPPTGDPARHLAGGLVYETNNRNKKSIMVDLKKDENVQALYKLIKSVDVMIESFRPGVMKRIGLDYETLKEIKEDIVYCSLSGFGQSGEFAHLGSHDLNYQALSGLLSQYVDDQYDPVHPTFTTADYTGGLVASERISSALFHRERTGKGSYLDVALNDTFQAMLTSHAGYQMENNKKNGPPFLEGSVVCYHLYRTKDDRFMSLAALEPQFWMNFCKGVNKENWEALAFETIDSTFYREMKALFYEGTMKDWEDFGEKHDCCLFPVLTIEEVLGHSYGETRGLFSKHEEKLIVSTYTDAPHYQAIVHEQFQQIMKECDES